MTEYQEVLLYEDYFDKGIFGSLFTKYYSLVKQEFNLEDLPHAEECKQTKSEDCLELHVTKIPEVLMFQVDYSASPLDYKQLFHLLMMVPPSCELMDVFETDAS